MSLVSLPEERCLETLLGLPINRATKAFVKVSQFFVLFDQDDLNSHVLLEMQLGKFKWTPPRFPNFPLFEIS